MATTLTATLTAAYQFNQSRANTGAAPTTCIGTGNVSASIDSSVANTTAGGGDVIYGPVVRTLNASTTEDIDLSGSLEMLTEDAAVFARYKGIFIWLLSASQTAPDGTAGNACTSILVGGDAADALGGSGKMLGDTSDKVRIFNGGFFCWCAGNAAGCTVTATTADILQVQNEDGSVAAKYMIMVIGGDS